MHLPVGVLQQNITRCKSLYLSESVWTGDTKRLHRHATVFLLAWDNMIPAKSHRIEWHALLHNCVAFLPFTCVKRSLNFNKVTVCITLNCTLIKYFFMYAYFYKFIYKLKEFSFNCCVQRYSSAKFVDTFWRPFLSAEHIRWVSFNFIKRVWLKVLVLCTESVFNFCLNN